MREVLDSSSHGNERRGSRWRKRERVQSGQSISRPSTLWRCWICWLFWKRASASLKRRIADGDLDQAQDRVFDAMEASDGAERISLAKEALAISPLCADAYVVLAEEAATLDHGGDDSIDVGGGRCRGSRRSRFRGGCRSFLGCARDPSLYAGAAWPSRARSGPKASTMKPSLHYQDMLRLNPGDNQGIRFSLIDALLQLGRDDEARQAAETIQG